MYLAKSTLPTHRYGESPSRRFIAACRELATENLSKLAERIEPVFRIAELSYQPTEKQLFEIVDHVRLA